jgi:hypothetical protein
MCAEGQSRVRTLAVGLATGQVGGRCCPAHGPEYQKCGYHDVPSSDEAPGEVNVDVCVVEQT